jgi:putative glutamine amidotransferase
LVENANVQYHIAGAIRQTASLATPDTIQRNGFPLKSPTERNHVKPVIGITASAEQKPKGAYTILSDDYLWSVSAAGGLPIILPSSEDPDSPASCLDLVDALLFSGGPDVLPQRFGEQPSRHITSWNSARDEFEISLFAQARARRLPILGICRGEQLVNIAMGGNLYQDIFDQYPGAMGHYPSPERRDEPYHAIELVPGASLLRSAFGLDEIDEPGAEPLLVNSFHHQAVKDLAPGLRVTARTADGLVEAYEGEEGSTFLVCVQFHPECMTRRFPLFLGLFRALVAAAVAYKKNRAPMPAKA